MSQKHKITAEKKIKLVHVYLLRKITQRYTGETVELVLQPYKYG